VAYAQSAGVQTLTYPIPKKGGFPGLTPTELVEALGAIGADYVLLAGYLKVLCHFMCLSFHLLDCHFMCLSFHVFVISFV
jgi:phosphoribosylglycinamide formyltransferase